MNNEWEYYNHALVPTTAPHVDPDTSWMKDSAKWKEYAGGKTPLFARWVSDFDCKAETEWWHCIKDEKFDFSQVSSNTRRKIRKGIKETSVCLISPKKYAEQLASVNCKARMRYGEKFDYSDEKNKLQKEFADSCNDGNTEYLGVFLKDTEQLVGYGIYELHDDWILQSVVKSDPEYMKYYVNAALVYYALERYFGEEFSIKYLTNGTKNVLHETNYHEYLMEYFGFRKAYCRLHIKYRGWVGAVVAVLYPFRKLFYKMKGRGPARMVRAVLKMEEIHRTFR